MPFAGFRDFPHCVEVQMSQGKNREDATRICGAIQSRTEAEIADKGLQAQYVDEFMSADIHRAVSLRPDGTCPPGFKKVGNRCEPSNESSSGGTILPNKRGSQKMLSNSDKP